MLVEKHLLFSIKWTTTCCHDVLPRRKHEMQKVSKSGHGVSKDWSYHLHWIRKMARNIVTPCEILRTRGVLYETRRKLPSPQM
jgi:hypothetical protein